MPIQIALANNTPDATLELREAQPMGAGDFAAFLIVRSGVFAAAMPFLFTKHALQGFVAELDGLLTAQHAKATLPARAEGSFVALERTAGDGVSVNGTLRDPEGDQRLEFRFPAAPASLEPLLEGVRRLAAGYS
jgi:hypothetical protein